ncbi:hypothetical protein AB0C38_44785 [Amycolatopsis sp. NPDC048633]|uniref:hypothetical protein n=1 Tax=Amycolatopsis sp. NPDC048633 TaxID=3157095 RepID=UPI0033DB7AAC
MPHDPGTDGGAPDGFVTGAGAEELPPAGGGGGVPVDVGAAEEVAGGGDEGGACAAGSPEQAASAGTARQAASNGRHVLVVVGWGTAIVSSPVRLARSFWPIRAGAAWTDSPTGVRQITPAGWRPGPVATGTPSTMDN